MRRQYLAIAFVASAAVVCAYYLGSLQGPPATGAHAATSRAVHAGRGADGKAPAARAGTSARAAAPPFPRGVRLRNVFSELQARANAGDVAAATRLYRDLSLCGRVRGMDWGNSLLADELLSERVDGMPPEQLDNYRAQLDAIESRERNLEKLRDFCAGAGDAMLDALVPNLQRAAQLGEEHARACYLSAGPNYDARGLMNHPGRLDEYRRSVPSLVEAGIAAGDWKVVDILRNAYQPGAEGLLAGALGSDPYQYYRYLKLYRLGAEPYRIGKLDRQLAAASVRIEPERRIEADAWAEAIFRRNFNASNSTESTVAGWDPCSFPYE